MDAPPSQDPIIAKAEKLLREMIAAYKSAPALIDTVRVEVEDIGLALPEHEEKFYFGPGHDSIAMFGADQLTTVGGMLYYTSEASPNRYVRAPITEDPAATLEAMGSKRPLLYFTLRYARPVEEVIRSLTVDVPDPMKIAGYRMVTDEAGRELEQISLTSPSGHASINVDPETKLIASIETQFRDPAAPVPTMRTQRITFSPRVVDELPLTIEFDPGGLVPVSNFTDFLRPVWIGDEAPDFTLPILEGGMVSLSQFRGSVVVLDLWATWCMPCRRGLPLLHQFAEQAGKGVSVYAVNVTESGSTPEERIERAAQYWTEQDFSLKSLIDTEGTMTRAYGGHRGIPLTFVIDREGIIRAVYTQFEENMIELLEREVDRAFEAR